MDYRSFYYTPEQLLQYARFKKCKKCGGNVLPVKDGEYKCESCGEIYLDDYGKVKKFLEDNKNVTMQDIIQHTGVPRKMVKSFLGECKLEIKQPSSAYVRCSVCGAMLTCGSICNRCGRNIAGNDFNNPKSRIILNKIGDNIRNKEEDEKNFFKRAEKESKLVSDLKKKKKMN